MNKINTSGWKEFEMKSLGFYNFHGERLNKGYRVEGTTPFITAGKVNRGVAQYIETTRNTYHKAITVDMFGNCFFQNEDCAGDDNVYFFVNNNISDNQKLFISASINAVTSIRFAYKEQFRQPHADALTVHLPATQSGEPDWAYIDSFMQNVMNESKACLSNLRLAKASISSVDISKWKDFEIGKLFKIIKPSVFHTRQVVEDDEGIPYVVRTKFNNGIKFRVVKTEDMSPSPSGVISFGSENATFFYQPEKFVSGRDIYYLDTQGISERTCQFMAACLQPIARKYSYNYGLFPDLLKQEHIKLPADSDGKPDWVYMDLHMETILTQSKKLMDALKEATL